MSSYIGGLGVTLVPLTAFAQHPGTMAGRSPVYAPFGVEET
jgi:hypothetical protein